MNENREIVETGKSGKGEPADTKALIVPADRLKSSLNGRFNHDSFTEHARASADSNGCCFLFDFPAALLNETADNAAAILCPAQSGSQLIFLAYRHKTKRIVVVDAAEAPVKLVDFAWSFARVLTYLPSPGDGSSSKAIN